MLLRLADLKCFDQDFGSHESYLTESEWAEVKMMFEVLQILHTATIYFQKQDLTPGERLLHWREVIFNPRKTRRVHWTRRLTLKLHKFSPV